MQGILFNFILCYVIDWRMSNNAIPGTPNMEAIKQVNRFMDIVIPTKEPTKFVATNDSMPSSAQKRVFIKYFNGDMRSHPKR